MVGCEEGVGRAMGGCCVGGCSEGVPRVFGGHTHILDSCNDKRVSVCHV